ncbi:MAG: TonB-dependent receptor [Bryobacterales bacterium]|nr:TonB-dependent receptor [Bryobacterales bacterium]
MSLSRRIVLPAVILCGIVSAQTEKAQLAGTVVDSSQAVVAGAQVTATHTATGARRSTTSSEQGFYSLPFLAPGMYDIQVGKEGFRTLNRSAFKLDVAQVATMNFGLEVGAVSEQVTVTAQQVSLDTGSASLAHTMENQRIVNLPTNGRNSYGFATLVPGVRASRGFSEVAYGMYNDQFVSINGSRPNQNSFLLDGGANSNPAFNGPAMFPSLDSVEEYKVQTNNFSAEFSNAAGGVINLVTKSGTNQLHGALFDFLRNDKMAANDFFINRAGRPKAPFRFNQFGAAVGGPLVIPKVYNGKDKTFFFASFEGLRWVRGLISTGTMPTVRERDGDFSESRNGGGALVAIYDPLTNAPNPAQPGRSTRQPFAGNRIPLQRFDAVSRNLLKSFPFPNAPGNPFTAVGNYAVNPSAPIIKNTVSARVDHNITGSQRIYGRFTLNNTPHNRPRIYGDTPELRVGSPVLGNDQLNQRSMVLNYNSVIRPTLVMELSSSFLRYSIQRQGPALDYDPRQLGLPNYLGELYGSLRPCFPSVGITGFGVTIQAPDSGGGLLGSCGLLHDGYETFHQYGNATNIRGSHTLKFGGNFGINRLSTGRYGQAVFGTNFTPAFTQGPDPVVASATGGLAFASFLLGTGGGQINSDGPGQNHLFRYYGVYLQDDWKVSRRLTLNLGLRYDENFPWTERYNRHTDFDYSSQSPLSTPAFPVRGGLAFPGVGGLSRSAFERDSNNFAPRFGFALTLGPGTVLRGGYGIFFAPITGGGYNGAAVPISGYQTQTQWVGTLDGITPVAYLANPFPTGFIRATGATAGLGTLLGQNVTGMDRGRINPYAQQWNFNVQRTLPGSFLFDFAYAGSRGLHLFGNLNPNQLPNDLLSLGDRLRDLVPNPFAGRITTGAVSAANVARNQLLRPYPQFSGVTIGNISYGASTYHALQGKVERRFSRGFSLLFSYTFSKLMDDVAATTTGFPGEPFAGDSIQDFNNRRNERSVASYDTPHFAAINGVWELPFGRGKRYLSQRGLARVVFGNWQINGISTFRTGVPLSLTMSSNTLFNFGGPQRPNWTGGRTGELEGRIASRINKYFDSLAYSAPSPYAFGNTPRFMSGLRGPGTVNVDFSVFKNFPLYERLTLQFRAEAFNIANRAEFGLPNTSIGSPAAGVITNQANPSRDVQFALKLIF